MQFHMHSPSEHTFNGEHTDLELHVVDFESMQIVSVLFNTDHNAKSDNDLL